MNSVRKIKVNIFKKWEIRLCAEGADRKERGGQSYHLDALSKTFSSLSLSVERIAPTNMRMHI